MTKKKANKGGLTGGLTGGVDSPNSQGENEGQIQSEVLAMLKKGHTQKEIALRRKVSKQAISKIVKKLKLKGKLRGGLTKTRRVPGGGVDFSTKKTNKKEPIFRYHNLHFVVTPYYVTDKYKRIQKERGNIKIRYGCWNIYLHKKTIQVRNREGHDFQARGLFKTIRLSQDSFNKHIQKAAKDLGFSFIKERYVGVKQVAGHMAHVESGIAKKIDDCIMLRTKSGKVWFLIDKSKGLTEHEFVHPKDHLQHAIDVEPYIDDFRLNKPPTNSELMQHIGLIIKVMKDQATQNMETAAATKNIVMILTTMLTAVKSIVPQETKESGIHQPTGRPDYVG